MESKIKEFRLKYLPSQLIEWARNVHSVPKDVMVDVKSVTEILFIKLFPDLEYEGPYHRSSIECHNRKKGVEVTIYKDTERFGLEQKEFITWDLHIKTPTEYTEQVAKTLKEHNLLNPSNLVTHERNKIINAVKLKQKNSNFLMAGCTILILVAVLIF